MSASFERIRKGLQETISHAKSNFLNSSYNPPKRCAIGSGGRFPRGPALFLLNVIKRNPKSVANLIFR